MGLIEREELRRQAGKLKQIAAELRQVSPMASMKASALASELTLKAEQQEAGLLT